MNNTQETDVQNSERRGIQVISRAAAIMRALKHRPDGLSLGELSKLSGLPRSTVQRIVDALNNEGFVIAASATNGVRLGPTILALSVATKFHIAELARQTLEAISNECGDTTDLSIFDQDKMIFVDQVSGSHRLTALSSIGFSFPLHAAANGKAVLAALPSTELNKLKKRIALTRFTQNTITSWDALEDELNLIRKTGLAFDREENSHGISAVAVAIKSPTGEYSAISIPVPTQRFIQNEKLLSLSILKHCKTLQNDLANR